MSDIARFREICNDVRVVMSNAPTASLEADEPVREFFKKAADRLVFARRAEALLTSALAEFPLHPFFLYWRGRIRIQMLDAHGTSLAMEGAREDFTLATEVAPNYLAPQIELAHSISVQLNDDRQGAVEFARLAELAGDVLCECIASRVEALNYDGKDVEARTELKRWLPLFPSNADLQEAARSIKVARR